MEKEGGDSLGGDGFLGRAKNHPLSKPMVDHDQERVETRGGREVGDEIARDLLERARGDRFYWQQGGYSRMGVGFVLLAGGAAFNVLADKGGKPRPPKFGSDKLARFQEARMAGGCVIMAAFKDGVAKGIIGGDIDTAFVGKDAGFDLPVGESRTEGERNILMHRLEGLEDEGVTRGCGFNSMREGGVN